MDRFQAAKRRRDLKVRAIVHLGGACRICGYDKPIPSAYDFHHEDAFEKDFSISSRMTSFEAIRKELDKCVLLCCRCHREVHEGYHPRYLVDPDAQRGQLDLGPDEG